MNDLYQYQAGAKAARDGLPLKANPYRRGTEKRNSWHLGWLATQRGDDVAPPPPPPCPKYEPKDTPHRRMIFKVVEENPGSKRVGFRKAVEGAIEDQILNDPELEYCYLLDLRESLERGDLAVVPDAFRIDPSQRVVTVWEVEHTYRYEKGKYWDVFWLLDEFCWDLRIFRVDAISGGVTEVNTFEDIWHEGQKAKKDALAHA
jgi:hypothetical protein